MGKKKDPKGLSENKMCLTVFWEVRNRFSNFSIFVLPFALPPSLPPSLSPSLSPSFLSDCFRSTRVKAWSAVSYCSSTTNHCHFNSSKGHWFIFNYLFFVVSHTHRPRPLWSLLRRTTSSDTPCNILPVCHMTFRPRPFASYECAWVSRTVQRQMSM